MNFEPGDIVIIDHHPLSCLIGSTAEIRSVHPRAALGQPLLAICESGDVTWYVIIDGAGKRRAAAHPWLRKAPPITWNRKVKQCEIA